MPTIVRLRRRFPSRGLGMAAPRWGGWGGTLPPIIGSGVGVDNSATPAASSATPVVTHPGHLGPARRIGTSPVSTQTTQTTSSTLATAADQSAFQQALQNASNLGILSAAQITQIQAQALGMSDADLQSLTSSINSLITSSQASATTATPATPAATSTTSWWNGTTTLFGSTWNNSTMAIGAGLLAVLGYAFLKKK